MIVEIRARAAVRTSPATLGPQSRRPKCTRTPPDHTNWSTATCACRSARSPDLCRPGTQDGNGSRARAGEELFAMPAPTGGIEHVAQARACEVVGAAVVITGTPVRREQRGGRCCRVDRALTKCLRRLPPARSLSCSPEARPHTWHKHGIVGQVTTAWAIRAREHPPCRCLRSSPLQQPRPEPKTQHSLTYKLWSMLRGASRSSQQSMARKDECRCWW